MTLEMPHVKIAKMNEAGQAMNLCRDPRLRQRLTACFDHIRWESSACRAESFQTTECLPCTLRSDNALACFGIAVLHTR